MSLFYFGDNQSVHYACLGFGGGEGMVSMVEVEWCTRIQWSTELSVSQLSVAWLKCQTFRSLGGRECSKSIAVCSTGCILKYESLVLLTHRRLSGYGIPDAHTLTPSVGWSTRTGRGTVSALITNRPSSSPCFHLPPFTRIRQFSTNFNPLIHSRTSSIVACRRNSNRMVGH